MSKAADDNSNSGGKYARSKSGSGAAHGARAVAECSPALLRSAIAAVLTAGDAITFGTTRDGGAVSIALYADGIVDKLYVATVAEIDALMEDLESTAGS